jgi:hypothetical protein
MWVPQCSFSLVSASQLEEQAGLYLDLASRVLQTRAGEHVCHIAKDSAGYTLYKGQLINTLQAEDLAALGALHPTLPALGVRASERIAARRAAATDSEPGSPSGLDTSEENLQKPNEPTEPQAPPPLAPPSAIVATGGGSYDRNDRYLVDKEFEMACSLAGEEVTHDVFASAGGHHVPTYWTKEDDAFTKKWVNGSFWINCPFDADTIMRAFRHCAQGFRKCPDSSSYLVVTPQWAGAPWTPATSPDVALFSKLWTWPAGTLLFSRPGDTPHAPRVPDGPTKWAVDLWYLPASARVVTSVTDDVVAHMRCAHLSGGTMCELINHGTLPVKRLGPNAKATAMEVARRCRTCRLAKSTKPRVPTVTRTRAATPFELCFADVAGPFCTSVTHDSYVLALRCDLTRYTALVCLPSRKDVASGLKSILSDLQNTVGRYVRNEAGGVRQPIISVIQVDSAMEFLGKSSPWVKLCQELGIVLRYTSPYSHHQNGVIERQWRSLQEAARSMLYEARLDSSYWPHAIIHANYILNRVPSRDHTSPYHALTGSKPDLTRLRIFGAAAFKHLPYQARSQASNSRLLEGELRPRKLAARAQELLYVGNSETSKSFKLVDPQEPRTVVLSDAVYFCEELITDRVNTQDSAMSAFDVTAPEGRMLDTVTEEFTVLNHRTMRRRDRNAAVGEVSDELLAIFLVRTTDNPHGIWAESDYLLSTKVGYDNVHAYLTAYHEDHRNTFYPLFERASYEVEAPARGARAPRHRKCIVVGLDIACRDNNDVRIALSSGDGHAFLDVPRKTLSTDTPSGFTALAVRLSESNATGVPTEGLKGERAQLVTEPRSSKQAYNAPDATEWRAAMKKEIDTLTSKQTFEFVNAVPAGRRAISCIFKLKVKWRKDGTLDKRKARLVALGNHQVFGLEFSDTFAATSQLSSVHLLLCIAVQHGWHAFHFDIQSAFVNAELTEEIFVSLPPEAGPGRRLARLRKSLYGLKQAAHSWAAASDRLLMAIPGMTKSNTEAAWYHYTSPSGDVVAHVLVYVDDYVVCTNSPSWYASFVSHFASIYELSDLGVLSNALGMGIEWGNNKVVLTRRVPIERTLQKFGLADARPSMYPFEPGCSLKIPEEGDSHHPFLNLLGELRYHARSSRPDINTALAVLGRFSAKNQSTHYEALKRVARYLKGTPEMTLILQKGVGGVNGSLRLSMYVDASYASCPDTGRSISGYVICLNGNVVLAISKRQATVACSTTESEIIAFSEGCKDLIYVHRLVSQFHQVELPMTVHEDNLGTIDVLSNPVNNGRTKHIDVRHFWVRELVEAGTIRMQHIDTDKNVADFLTKPLTGEKFRTFREAVLGHVLV